MRGRRGQCWWTTKTALDRKSPNATRLRPLHSSRSSSWGHRSINWSRCESETRPLIPAHSLQPLPPSELQAVVAQAAGAVGLVVINHEPGGVTFSMPGVSDLGEDIEGSGVNIPVAMVRGTGGTRRGILTDLFGARGPVCAKFS